MTPSTNSGQTGNPQTGHSQSGNKQATNLASNQGGQDGANATRQGQNAGGQSGQQADSPSPAAPERKGEDRANAGPNAQPEAHRIEIDGMKGEACVTKVRDALTSIPGITVDSVTQGSATIRGEQGDGAFDAIRTAGYQPRGNGWAAGQNGPKGGDSSGRDPRSGQHSREDVLHTSGPRTEKQASAPEAVKGGPSTATAARA